MDMCIYLRWEGLEGMGPHSAVCHDAADGVSPDWSLEVLPRSGPAGHGVSIGCSQNHVWCGLLLRFFSCLRNKLVMLCDMCGGCCDGTKKSQVFWNGKQDTNRQLATAEIDIASPQSASHIRPSTQSLVLHFYRPSISQAATCEFCMSHPR